MQTILRLLAYVRPYRALVAVGLLCMAATVGLDLVIPRLIGWVVDRVVTEGQASLLAPYALGVTGVAIVKGLFIYGQRLSLAQMTQKVIYDLRNALYGHLQRQSFKFYDTARTGELMSRVTQDVEILRRFLGFALVNIVSNALTFILVLIILLRIHPKLTLVSLATAPLLLWAIRQFGIYVRPAYRRIQEKQANMTAALQENVTGVRVVRAFSREEHEVAKFHEVNWDFMQQNIKAVRLWAFYFPLMNLITSLGLVVLISYGGMEVIAGRLSVGDLVAFSFYLQILMVPLRMVGWLTNLSSRAMASGERIFEILDAPPHIADAPDAVELGRARGLVRFEGVHFSYDDGAVPLGGADAGEAGAGEADEGRGGADAGEAGAGEADEGRGGADAGEAGAGRGGAGAGEAGGGRRGAGAYSGDGPGEGRSILSDINLEARPGEMVALLGPTGSGKSTLVQLIPRFYDVTAGRITIDGHDVRDLKLTSLRRQVGMVLQETFLFSASIRENIAYGRPDASLEEIIAVSKSARLHQFIETLPDGYDTIVGERGVGLSGGQRQRVAIARALLMDPQILILDDATASVDTETEYLIQQALNVLMEGRTTFVIAQRLGTVQRADQIIVLDEGRIVQRGTHDKLKEEPGLYRDIYRLQFHREGAKAI